MKTYGLKRPSDPTPEPQTSTGPIIYGGNTTPPYFPTTQGPPTIYPQIAYYPQPPQTCCPKPEPCLRDLDVCGLNGVNSGTYDPSGVTDAFIKDTEEYEIPIFGGKGNGGTVGEDGTVWTPGINPGGSPYGEQTGINPYPLERGAGTVKEIEIIDKDGNPLQNAHVSWTEGGKKVGTITNAAGLATVEVADQATQVTISYVGKRTHIAAFSDLGSLITLQDNVNNLPPVVVKTPTTKPTTTTTKPTTTTAQVDKKSGLMKTAIIGIGALLLLSAITKKSKGKSGMNGGLNGPKGKKKKNSKKSKKSKGLRQPAEITL